MVSLDALVNLELKDGVLPGELNRVDDVVIEVGTNEADFVAVLDSREG